MDLFRYLPWEIICNILCLLNAECIENLRNASNHIDEHLTKHMSLNIIGQRWIAQEKRQNFIELDSIFIHQWHKNIFFNLWKFFYDLIVEKSIIPLPSTWSGNGLYHLANKGFISIKMINPSSITINFIDYEKELPSKITYPWMEKYTFQSQGNMIRKGAKWKSYLKFIHENDTFEEYYTYKQNFKKFLITYPIINYSIFEENSSNDDTSDNED